MIFTCVHCKVLENTACCNYNTNGNYKICSKCDPSIGVWHNRFRRATEDGRDPDTGEILPPPTHHPLL